jgi:pimeloyl-ACP methyl ester carboxylesterase/class 3 adenylate cyclase
VRIDPVRYALAGDCSIAYQVYGDGPVPVIGIPGAASSVELVFEWAPGMRYFERLGTFATVAMFDKRGTGGSERIIGAPSVEERVEDVHAVMDAAGFERAAIWGLSEGGPLAVLFAATYPERTTGLILQGSFARLPIAPDYQIGWSPEVIESFIDYWSSGWGTPETATVQLACPSQLGDAELLRFLNRYERASATPSTLRAVLALALDIDVRHILPTVRCPTLVLHATRDALVPIALGRYLAEHIGGAEWVPYESTDHFPNLDGVDAHVDAMEEFLTGQISTASSDRVLATILFSDIVGSTDRASELGDRRWRAVLEQHDQLMGREIDRHRGRWVKSTGDGCLATFDSPARAIRCAHACVEGMNKAGIDIRTGIHTGEIELRGADIAGMAVHIAARVAANAQPGEVLISSSVPPLVVGSGLRFAERGLHELKGVPDEWSLYALVS